MEVLTSAWFIFIICCTDLLGFKQCTAYPVPNLLGHYQGSSKNNWVYKYQQSRNPIIFYDKFTFSNKEPPQIVHQRSSKVKHDSGKIFFPDEISPSKPDQTYHFMEESTSPVWKIHNRPTPSVKQNKPSWTDLEDMKPISTVDGSLEHESEQLPLSSEQSVIENVDISDSVRSSVPTKVRPDTEETKEENVAAAVNQFYEWVKRTKTMKQEKMQNPSKPCHGVNNCNKQTPNKTEFVSDQSLVAGLEEQKCPEGQIRLANNECKVKVSV